MVLCPSGFRAWIGLFFGAAIGYFGVNVLFSFIAGGVPVSSVEAEDKEPSPEQEKEATYEAPRRQRRACLALVGAQGDLEDMLFRVLHLSKMHSYEFARRYLVLDLGGAELPAHIRSLADDLVHQRTIDTWMRVDHSQNYIMRLLAAKMRSAQQEISAENATRDSLS
eukprot:Skav228112  [mRNA]  locus=scaffold1220:9279:12698:+ [translate_table: standard]